MVSSVKGTPYIDEDWETVGVFPAPPEPLVVFHWAHSDTVPTSPGLKVSNRPLFGMLTQRKRSGTEVRVVPCVMDAFGNVLAVEPGESWRHLTFVSPQGNGNLTPEQDKHSEKWVQTRPTKEPQPAED